MPLDDELQNPDNAQPRQGQQGDFGNDVVGVDGSVLNSDGSAEGTDLNGDEDLTPNESAEDDPQANREEQQAT
jgi:hypothetical protein